MKYTMVPENNRRNLFRIVHHDGTRGGLIENERNLSQKGDCWIEPHAIVMGGARVTGNARVLGFSRVYGEAKIYDDAVIDGNACVFGNVKICGLARIRGSALINCCGQIDGEAEVSGTARLIGPRHRIFISGHAKVRCGRWSKSPPYFRGTRHAVSQSGPNQISIGCQTFSFKHWLNHGRKMAESFGFSDREYQEYSTIVRAIIKIAGGVK